MLALTFKFHFVFRAARSGRYWGRCREIKAAIKRNSKSTLSSVFLHAFFFLWLFNLKHPLGLLKVACNHIFLFLHTDLICLKVNI